MSGLCAVRVYLYSCSSFSSPSQMRSLGFRPKIGIKDKAVFFFYMLIFKLHKVTNLSVNNLRGVFLKNNTYLWFVYKITSIYNEI